MHVSSLADAVEPPVTPGAPQRVRMAVATGVMLSGSIMMALIFTVLSPVLPQIAEHYGASGGVTIAQFIMSAPGVGVIVGGLTGGFLVDRFGRKRLLCIALALFAVAGCAPLYVDNAWGLLASRAVLGWSGATTQAAVIGMIASTFREPLRAKISLTFVEYISPAEIVKEEGKKSPDLTHLVQVRAGDTLPLLCDRIYRDSRYYMDVARINGLSSFRHLTPGMTLRFPPLA